MLKPDLAINNQQWLICQKTEPNQTNQSFSSRLIDLARLKNSKSSTIYL